MNAGLLARDEETDDVVGFVCGMTDQVLILYIWDLEVMPDYKEQGVEDELLAHLLDRYSDLYQINANPDSAIQAYFKSAEFLEVDAS